MKFIITLIGIFAVIISFLICRSKSISLHNAEEMCYSSRIQTSEARDKLLKIDIIILFVIIMVYSMVALYDLGSRSMPQTSLDIDKVNEDIILDLGDNVNLSEINYFLGNIANRNFRLYSWNSTNSKWDVISDFNMKYVFRWGKQQVNCNTRYIALRSLSDSCSIRELVLKDQSGNIILPSNANKYSKLFDEQDLYKEVPTYRDETYFDEIYHARTAYEFIHGLKAYENTHPPLGKILISIGMLIFGENPFGWRIIGTLFGIAMVPVIYLFSKKMFKKTWASAIVTVIFSFDFMHFVQTRIATIDVFVTFFIIVSYYFMYQYCTMTFNDTPLIKTLRPLAESGIAIALAIASKWTGLYAGVGLAIIFLCTMIRRYIEYRYAKRDKSSSTNGILHSTIVNNFNKNIIITLLFCIIVFVCIPILVYILSYIPFKDGTDNGLVTRAINNIKTMFSYHSKLNATHPFGSKWYTWPLDYRPIWYSSAVFSGGKAQGISAFGNPLVWWIGIPAFIYMVALTILKRDKKAFFLCVGYLSQYLPWSLVTRVVFIYHYFPSTPFIVLMIGYSMISLSEINKIGNKNIKESTWINIFIVYTVLVLVLFMLFYPVLAGQTVSIQFVYKYLRWFSSWRLIV
ncbi:phospholipid carrier-dependent glycosyltransferase [Clostridium sp. MSJ-8]|uniref:phospholipid carrier-dependent glycosyltransferase n=1 Tax=Clostridium sp. MSJ-8 TaxID=2841510 RepID=UPI001C0EF376|nr:phospholipid carrier-dependent glycosyltransferase [Clostridium sp. MSJ-8]MBU5487754.1 phospholipid carrier-dependent glycosyltransferase [Clostridium sp. MSJ-8]